MRAVLIGTMLASVFLAVKPAGASEIRGRAEVIDGDTIKVAGETVRLEGVDAPESRQECERASGTAYACGRDATRHLAKLIGRQEVACSVVGKDAYDRSLGLCRAGGADINASMVTAGWAMAFVRYSDRFIAEEKAARASGAGLWAGTFDPPWEWRAAQVADAGPTGDCVIKGNISGKGERVYHMPFHQNYDRTRINETAGERWFCTEAEASAAGWRRAAR